MRRCVKETEDTKRIILLDYFEVIIDKQLINPFVSGLSVTYSSNPSCQHLWTFASGHGEKYYDRLRNLSLY